MAMQTFALVEWIGDDKPDCWQVIKSADAFPQVKEIIEGAVLDGIWKEGEETSPAKILKVHDSKHYLQTVKENEYCKPWRSQVPVKRAKSAPRTLQEFVTEDGEPGTSKNQPHSITSGVQKLSKKIKLIKENQGNKKQKITKKAPTSSIKKKSNNYQIISPSESEEEESEPSSKIMKSSKDEAEKVLAAAILQKRRTSSPIIPPADVHKQKQVSPIKGNNVSEDGDGDGDDELSEINSKVEAFGLPRIRTNREQECCRCCMEHEDKLRDLQQEVADLKRSFRKFKKHCNDIRDSQKEGSGESNSTSTLERSYREAVKNSTSLFGTTNYLMRNIYSKEEIISHSVSGKAANSKLAAKPKFDERIELVKKIAIEVHGIEHATQPKITAKIQAVQKAVKREMEGKNS